MVSKDFSKLEPSNLLLELSVSSRFDTDNTFKLDLNSDALSFSGDIVQRLGKKLEKVSVSSYPSRLNIKQIEKQTVPMLMKRGFVFIKTGVQKSSCCLFVCYCVFIVFY